MSKVDSNTCFKKFITNTPFSPILSIAIGQAVLTLTNLTTKNMITTEKMQKIMDLGKDIIEQLETLEKDNDLTRVNRIEVRKSYLNAQLDLMLQITNIINE